MVPGRPSGCPAPLLPLAVLVVTVVSPCQPLDVDELCEIRCNMGRGGVLCKCNAFHFAGKRTSSSSSFSSSQQQHQLRLAPVARRKYHTNPNGGLVISVSGGDEAYDAREKVERGRAGGRKGDNPGMTGVLVERGEGRRGVTRLTSLVNTALDTRLISKTGTWQESSFPFSPDDAEY